MTKDKALDLALEALEIEDLACRYLKEKTPSQIVEAITAIKQARSEPMQEKWGASAVMNPDYVAAQKEKSQQALDVMAENARELGLDYEPVQDSTCSETLRAQGKAYPRTCRKCGLGPCIGATKQPPTQPAPAPGYCKHCKQYSIEEPLPAAQRQWVGLTDEEKRQIFEREDYQGWLDYINAIEAKLKEKNT
jgi:hypothetical protein